MTVSLLDLDKIYECDSSVSHDIKGILDYGAYIYLQIIAVFMLRGEAIKNGARNPKYSTLINYPNWSNLNPEIVDQFNTVHDSYLYGINDGNDLVNCLPGREVVYFYDGRIIEEASVGEVIRRCCNRNTVKCFEQQLALGRM